jgi:hypothetical protein
MNNISELINQINNVKLPSKINTDEVDKLFKLVKKNKTLPINYFQDNLTAINNTKLKCILCTRSAKYTCNDNNYCWIHSQNICL